MARQRFRRSPLLCGLLALTAPALTLGAQGLQASPAGANTASTSDVSAAAAFNPKQVDSAVLGWEGDRDAVLAHRDGSFDIRAGKRIRVGFGIYNEPEQLQWTNVGGYLPALRTTFERDNSTVSITNFADRVRSGGEDYVAVYSRVSVYNHDTVPHTLDPQPSPELLPLTSASTTVAPGETVHHDYVIATDKFLSNRGVCAFGAGCEAEDMNLSGGALQNSNKVGFTGYGLVEGLTKSGAAVSLTVKDVPAAGRYAVSLRYANAKGGDGQHTTRTASVTTGGRSTQITLPPTANWNTWTTASTEVELSAGDNALTVGCADGDSCNINLDNLAMVPVGAAHPTPVAIWLPDEDLVELGGYSKHFAHMKSYWNARLSGLAQVDLPDERLVNAYKSGYITTQIVKDGDNLNVGENGYDRLYDHDLIGILVSLLNQGDLTHAKDYLLTLTSGQFPDAIYKHSWPWALYLMKTGDTEFVAEHFATIRKNARAIETSRTGVNGIMQQSYGIDATGYWTVDNESALLGLLSYRSLAEELGEDAEAAWAADQYDSLLESVNTTLSSTIAASGTDTIPCAMDKPNSANRCSNVNDANWASSFLFGRWTWDGYLFDGEQHGPLIDLLDSTYEKGFADLQGLPAHTFGGYPGVSTSYNAGYGSAALRGSKYRSEGIYGYQYMITNAQSGPFSWWEGIRTVGTTNWGPGNHATAGTGSSPHIWGQANATKVLLDSLLAERSTGQVVVGRGVPTEWLRAGETVRVSNYPIADGGRMGATITTRGTKVTLRLTGDAPKGGALFSLPFFQDNIASASAGTVDRAAGTVTLPAGTKQVTVTLTGAPEFRELGQLDLDAYCLSTGNTGGAAGIQSCVDSHGEAALADLDEACAYAYPYDASVFARKEHADEQDSVTCQVS
ncbi:hypothetical protein AQ490_03340 [Wenjunlia vitaminophila]|uniref:CBM6 domain-containing protein n=1 Tax=Wenjunlia vitaminophila TaxID=76728 RepID=A0A0T6LTK7_WENVI|nr:carbohydrate-binding protein [Wenjunlia vitaminophila]KRV49249.1 hypothetical protein AQ490_03340 [Wenjunlia vitaminophila]